MDGTTNGANVKLHCGVMPPQLAKVLKTFPFRKPDRVAEGPNGEWLAEWHDDGNYFEIECFIPNKLEIMTSFNGDVKHWDLIGA